MCAQSSTKQVNGFAAGVLAVALSFSTTNYALAQDTTKTMPHHGKGMGHMQQEMMDNMMQKMGTCMGQMAPMEEADQEKMRMQMMEHMQSCMMHVKSDDGQDGTSKTSEEE